VDYEGRHFSTQEYAGDLKAEFDMLYAESAMRRRMMSVSAHDRIAGRPSQRRSAGRSGGSIAFKGPCVKSFQEWKSSFLFHLS